jgi:hypothetical protein
MQLHTGEKPPAGAARATIVDEDQEVQDALGFHEDYAGVQIPYATIMAKTTIENGAKVSEVLSHEVLELLADPFVGSEAEIKLVPHDGREYIVEVCDPVQGCGYDVGDPEGRPTGLEVADFCYPAWWGLDKQDKLNDASGRITKLKSFRSSVHNSFELAPKGYISYKKAGEWQQSFGPQADKVPDWDDRHKQFKALGP